MEAKCGTDALKEILCQSELRNRWLFKGKLTNQNSLLERRQRSNPTIQQSERAAGEKEKGADAGSASAYIVEEAMPK